MTSRLDQLTDFPALVEYLRDELEWPIPADISLDEATYDVRPEEIGLKSEVVGGGIEIKQLRPLNRAQPWGVFFLNLPNAKLPVTLVRNILGKLAIKKRASANRSEQAAFAKHDLLFIAATGSATDRRLAFAHFADDEVKGDAATLKVLGWDADDTPRRLGLTEASLKTKLCWPDNPADAAHWRKQWGEAFAHSDTRTVVRDSKTMAKALAALARRIRERAKELISAQTDKGSLAVLHKAFKEALIHDLTPEGFADTYAQTIAYGLLSTAISRTSGALTQDDMTANVAGTSPFLKEMLGTFIEAGGRRTGKANAGLDFDELGITEVVELMRNADMEAVLADFDRKNPDEDPVIHFYELFLKEYDAAQKVKRGVFYTPRPVVGFIVRSVDEVLRTEFGLEDGLASIATWGEVIAANPEIELPDGAELTDPFVRILDPATGTGTFLVECIELIHQTMVAKWQCEKKSKAEVKALWNDYVPNHLLPRLTGFELMMAPYAIAHVKLGLKLADTGYTFSSEARAQIYLTNALEPAQDLNMQLAFMSEALAHEAQAANEAKETRFTVVVGNPPYAVASSNRGRWIEGLMFDYKRDVVREETQIRTLSDDYVKFTRLMQWILERSGVGVSSLVTNAGYLDGIIFRDMRRSLTEVFATIDVVDLGGHGRRSQVKGTSDENVFDILAGVAVQTAVLKRSSGCAVRRVDIRGTRSKKAETLAGFTGYNLSASAFVPMRPSFLFAQRNFSPSSDESGFPPIPMCWGTGKEANDRHARYASGFKTQQDDFAIGFDRSEVAVRVNILLDANMTEVSLRSTFSMCNTYQWNFETARKRLPDDDWRKAIRLVQYRALDKRWTCYLPDVVTNPRRRVMDQISGNNPALVVSRQTSGGPWAHVLVTDAPTDMCALSVQSKEACHVFPLWNDSGGLIGELRPNISPAFVNRVATLTGLAWDDCVGGPKQGALGGIVKPKPEQTAMFPGARRERGEAGKSFGPRDVFDYIYAVLHSPAYRARYADYLKSDFARIPLPGNRELFEALVPLGTELVALHLLDADTLPILKDPKTIRLAGSGEARVAHKPEYDAKLGRVAINATRWFETVPEVAWNFHVGGYQPAQKWLKDRAAKGGKRKSDGRILTDEDILHYRRMIIAFTRTSKLMPKIDEVIDLHGGWPDAFRGMTDEVNAEAAE